MDIRLNDLNKTIVNCKKCPRLVKFVNKVSTNKRKQNKNEIDLETIEKAYKFSKQ